MSRYRIWLAEGALWGGAATVVLAAHLGGGLWASRMAQASSPPGLPDPIFIELAAMPTAAAPQDEVEQEQVEEAAPEPEPQPEPEPEPDFALPDMQQLEPLPDMNSLFPPPPEAVVLPKSARPKDRPEPQKPELAEAPRKEKPEPDPEPKKKREKKAAEAEPSRKATTRLQAPKGERTAAPQAQAGAPSKKQLASWQSKVNATVARHMIRAQSRLSGRGAVTLKIRFNIDPSGRVSGAGLVGSTGTAKNDAVLNRQAASLPRLPAPPSGKSTTLTLPVTVKLR